MINKETRFGRIRILPDGQLNVQLDRCIVENGEVVGSLENYPFKLTPICDVNTVLAEADEDLLNQGCTAIPSDVTERVTRICDVEHTPSVCAKFIEPVTVGRSGVNRECRFSLIDILPDSQLQVRFRKCIVEDGVIISPPEYHRVVLNPITNVPATLSAVNQHLVKMGCGAIRTEDIDRISRIYACEHTPLCVAKFRVNHWQQVVENYEKDGSEKIQIALTSAREKLAEAQNDLE